jgi:hypothetical protein
LIIDVVAVVEEEEMTFDLEVLFAKSLSEGDKQWERTSSKAVIDTRPYKGDLTRYMPNKGQFNYVHVDIDGKGGFAKVIEDVKKFGRYSTLMTLAEGPMGQVMFSIR